MISSMTDVQNKVIGQINIALQNLGAEVDLLCLVGSFGDTQEDEDILEMITEYNETGSCMTTIIDINDTPEDRRNRFKVVKE